jgi:GNAT superfamily N-acetyltransferase
VTDLERALAFMRSVNERRAGRVERLPWGELLVTDELPDVWDANLAIVDRWDGTAAELREQVDRVQGAAGFRHRKLVVYDQELGARLAAELEELEWPFRNRYAVMSPRRAPDRVSDPGLAGEIARAMYDAAKRDGLRDDRYGSDDTVAESLVALGRRTARAVDVRYFGGVVDGVPASYCELRSDGRTAQIEDVATVPRFRNRGLARATVLAAADAARAAGHELIFLVADTADWPIEIYRRLGFDELGSEWNSGRPGQDD